MLSRVLLNFGRMLRGRGIAAVCTVSATALTANALPVEQFGLIMLIHAYIMVIKGSLNFRTFEAIVRFGIPLQEGGDEERLKSLIRSTFVLDLVSSLVATAIGLAALPLAATLLHWDAQVAGWAWWYVFVLLSTPVNTGSGILRLYDRFDALGIQYTVGPLVRVVMVVAAWVAEAPMLTFLAAWGIAFSLGQLYMIARGFRELRRHLKTTLWQGFRWQELREQHSDFWRFIGVVYWQTTIDLLPKHVSTLLAGSLLGPAAAGLFRFAREAASVLAQPAVMLREVLFPDLTRAWKDGQGGFGVLPFRAALAAGAIGFAFVAIAWLAGTPILGLIGADYVPAKTLMVLLLIAASFDLAAASLRAAAYAMGRASALLRIHVLGIGSYTVMFVVFTHTFGLSGPGFASIVASLLTLGLTVRLVHRAT